MDLPRAVLATALAVGADDWLAELPSIIRDLEAAWSITVGSAYADATEALVADAVFADGMPAVLKVVVPREGNQADHEITVLELAGGAGCVTLLRAERSVGALLVERLGRSMFQLQLPIALRHEILCDLARRVWRPAAGVDLPTGADRAARLRRTVTEMWEELGRPCLEKTITHALACAERRQRAHDDERAVLVHGDVHQWNALQDRDGGFRLVDPDGYLAEAECDLGVLIREDPVELLDGDPHRRSRWLAERSGLDERAIWEWGVIERVADGLDLTNIGLQPVASEMLHTADHVAAVDEPRRK